MDTLIILCLALSSSFAAPQQYVPPNPTESRQPQNPRAFNSSPTYTNNAFLPNTQPVQSSSTVTEPFQQGVLSMQFNQDQDYFNSQNNINNQNPSIIRFQETTETENNYGQNSPDSFRDLKNSASGALNNGFVSTSGIRNGQITTSNNDINNNLNNPSVVVSTIGDFNQGANNQGLPNISKGSYNGNVVDNVDHNGNDKDLLTNGLARVQHSGKENSQNTNGNTELDDNFQSLSSIQNSADSENSDFIPSQSGNFQNKEQLFSHQNLNSNQKLNNNAHTAKFEINTQGLRLNQNNSNNENNDFIPSQSGNFQNNEQLFSHQNSNSNKNINNIAHAGEFEVNTQGLRFKQNNANNENNDFINEQFENSQTHGQFISHQNSNSNQNIDNNPNVGVAQNLEVTNEFNRNQGIQNHNDNQRGVITNKLTDHQKKEIISQCGRGLVHDARGTCVRPEVNRNIYVYRAPKMLQDIRNTSIEIPRPKLEYNIVFVRTPERNGNGEPIIVPPPQQKTLVYVLSKKKADGAQEIIEVPTGPKHNPEVYYVNYEEGDNPTLPGGIELQSALSAAVQTGQTVKDVLNESSLREDISHDNITTTANTGSKTEDTMFDGIGLHDTTGNNPANVLSIKQNTAGGIAPQSEGSLNGQHSTTGGIVHQNIGSLDGQRPTAEKVLPQSVGNFDGQHPTEGRIVHQNVGSLDGQRPTAGGIVHQSHGRLDGQHPTIGGVALQSVGSLDGQRLTAERISPQSVGGFNGPPPTGDFGVPLSFVNSGNVINTGKPPFRTNEGGYNTRQVLSTPPRQYNAY